MNKEYYLYSGQDKKEYFTLPTGWEPIHFVEAEESASLPSIEQMTKEALSKPAGVSSLQEILGGVKNIAIVVDDGTRPTPVGKILGIFLPQLEKFGFTPERISIVIALGTHETMKKEVLEARLGSDVVSRYKIIQHNAWQSDLVPVQLPGQGRFVKINPAVARADFKVAISSVLPHPMAGYGGGPKILMPGICNYEFIRDHHMQQVMKPRSVAGVVEGNPFHGGILEVARAVGLNFSIDCVYNQKGQAIRVVAGSLEAAFAEAVKVCFEKLGYKFNEKVDITISSTYPHTHGHQIVKGFSAPDVVTKATGAILLLAAVATPIPGEFLDFIKMIREKSQNKPGEYIRDACSRGEAFLPGKPIDYNMAMTSVFCRPKIRTILVSPVISKDAAKAMDIEHVTTIAEGMKVLEKSYTNAKVAIFPSGGLIVPITAWER
jgi:lactate racemase